MKENYTDLKNRLKDFVKTIPSVNFENMIDVDIVIPAKVYNPVKWGSSPILVNTFNLSSYSCQS